MPDGEYRNINAAIAAVGEGGTVVVCPGIYDEEVVVTKPLNLVGRRAKIDATGQPPLKVAGMTLPGSDGIAVLRPVTSRSAASRSRAPGMTPSRSAPARTCQSAGTRW